MCSRIPTVFMKLTRRGSPLCKVPRSQSQIIRDTPSYTCLYIHIYACARVSVISARDAGNMFSFIFFLTQPHHRHHHHHYGISLHAARNKLAFGFILIPSSGFYDDVSWGNFSLSILIMWSTGDRLFFLLFQFEDFFFLEMSGVLY